jgi:hypothetical protein
MADFIVNAGSSTVLGASDVAYINGFASSKSFKISYDSENGVIVLKSKSKTNLGTYEFAVVPGSKLAFLNGAVTVSSKGKISFSKKNIDAAINSQESFNIVAPAAFTLTTNVDLWKGTNNNDKIIADNTGAAEVTSAADEIDGGNGTDTLHIYSDGSTAGRPQLTSIETVSLHDENTDLNTSSANWDSATTINLIRGDGLELTVGANVATVGLTDLVVKSVAGTTDDTIINFGAERTSATVTLNKVTATAGAADENVHINGAALTTLNVTTTGTASSVDVLDADAAKTINVNAGVGLTVTSLATTGADATLNITGAGKVTLSQLDNDFDVVNASGNTGGVVLTVAANNADAVITLGSGKDTVTTDDDGFATTDKFAVNAGAGEDTLVIAADADVSTADEGGRYTNFEVLQRAANANTDLDVSVFGASTTITKASLGDGGLTKMQAALASGITLTADNAGSTFSLATATGTSDVLTVTSAHATATTSADLTTVTIDGFETLNFAANSGDATLAATNDRTAVSFTSAADLKTVNLSGTKSVNLNASANATKVTLISAEAVTGGAVIATGGQTGALVVTGSGAKDDITLGAVGTDGTVSVNAGAGDDTIKTTAAIAAAATSIVGGNGSDILSLSDGAATTAALTIADNTFRNVNVEQIDLSAAIAGDLNWTLGGFADRLATANGGVLKISAKATALVVAGDDITIDASALSTGNAANIDLKNTHAADDEASDIAVTGSDGADTIAVEEATAEADTIITVTSGKGNDKITVKTTADHDGKIVVDAGDGDDTVILTNATSDAVAADNVITLGKGNDTLALDSEGAATDFTIVMASTAANNGVDTISGFTQGTGGDVLKPDAFLNATAMNAVLSANPAASDVENDVNLLVDIAGGQDITTAAGLTAALGASGEYSGINMAGSAKAVFVTAASNAANQTQYVFFAESDAGGNITATLVGTVTGADIDSFIAANFAI